jgi:hypothetical protein
MITLRENRHVEDDTQCRSDRDVVASDGSRNCEPNGMRLELPLMFLNSSLTTCDKPWCTQDLDAATEKVRALDSGLEVVQGQELVSC